MSNIKSPLTRPTTEIPTDPDTEQRWDGIINTEKLSKLTYDELEEALNNIFTVRKEPNE
jgi:hypothetical protein